MNEQFIIYWERRTRSKRERERLGVALQFGGTAGPSRGDGLLPNPSHAARTVPLEWNSEVAWTAPIQVFTA